MSLPAYAVSVVVYEPSTWVKDMMYVTRDETNTASLCRIVSDTRASFFPEDYQHLLYLQPPLFEYEVDNDEADIETTTTGIQTPTTSSPHTKRNWQRHLAECDVRYIFSLRKRKVAKTASKLAARYGVTAKAIRDIWTGKTWRHLL
jgi:hypothetical protein